MNGEAWWYAAAAGGYVISGWAAAQIVWKARRRFLALIVAGVFLLVTLQCVEYATKAAGGL